MSIVPPPDLDAFRHCMTVPSSSLYTSGTLGPRAGNLCAPWGQASNNPRRRGDDLGVAGDEELGREQPPQARG